MLIKLKKKLKNKRGSEIVESVLMMAVVLAIIILVFYPQIKISISSIITTVTNEFVGIIDQIFGK